MNNSSLSKLSTEHRFYRQLKKVNSCPKGRAAGHVSLALMSYSARFHFNVKWQSDWRRQCALSDWLTVSRQNERRSLAAIFNGRDQNDEFQSSVEGDVIETDRTTIVAHSGADDDDCQRRVPPEHKTVTMRHRPGRPVMTETVLGRGSC